MLNRPAASRPNSASAGVHRLGERRDLTPTGHHRSVRFVAALISSIASAALLQQPVLQDR
jgi:hypothetical protein